MDNIEEIWNKGNEHPGQDEFLSADAILKTITRSSIGISSKMLKSIYLGIVLAFGAFGMLLYNILPYGGNPSVFILIAAGLMITAAVIAYLFLQIGLIRRMDRNEMNLRDVLVKKIKYLNTRFIFALHCISLSIVLATFTINLTMERSDGVFEVRKILLLSVFYLFAYAVSFTLSKIVHSAYDKQLRNALMNLEEHSYRSLDEGMKRHKRNRRIVLIVVSILLLSGIAALFFTI